MSISFQRAAKRYAQALLDDNAALFAGAGLSIKAGFVSWASLLRDIAEELGVDINSFSDLPSLAQFHLNQTGNRGGINQALVEEFVRIAEETESHRLIAGLPLRSIWTTNYDSLIEQAFQNAGKIVEVKRRPEDLTTTVRSRSAVVYKMHGDVTDLHRSVLTRDDYEQYDRERGVFRSALEGDLIQKTFLFAGFSFDDPNINFVLSKTRAALRQSQREHYYLLRCVKRKDFEDIKNPNDAVRDQRFGYAKALQDLRIADLSRYGIRSVLLDHYDQVLDFLRLVERARVLSRFYFLPFFHIICPLPKYPHSRESPSLQKVNDNAPSQRKKEIKPNQTKPNQTPKKKSKGGAEFLPPACPISAGRWVQSDDSEYCRNRAAPPRRHRKTRRRVSDATNNGSRIRSVAAHDACGRHLRVPREPIDLPPPGTGAPRVPGARERVATLASRDGRDSFPLPVF